jgi:hypothetical protein
MDRRRHLGKMEAWDVASRRGPSSLFAMLLMDGGAIASGKQILWPVWVSARTAQGPASSC